MSATPVRIPESLASLAVPVEDLAPYFQNPRTGDVGAIAESLRVNGQYKAIVVNRGTYTGRPNEILAGNHTWTAAKELGWEQIAATFVDVSDEDAARIVIVDNRTSDLAGYDSTMLASILADLPDLEGTGYDQDALDELLDDDSLPDRLTLPSDGQGTGETAQVEYLQWGYMQWSTTRVRITAEEVEALNGIYQQFVDESNSDLGFGWHLLQNAHKETEA
ncbi:ParB-like nuclease family protein [Streptomyces sp. 3212.3]|uniref:ParB/RepB/Spo0J family partition protein n=1 Tax=Streptomyces sp. 3212.3 TaxID=1938846 RepID=UPI000E3AB356|nr:ParB N-terminal domain-containing protein [Streptomyces sp. 3212.3]REE61400.1 ParB-like nuclease family protein [Streptomyces sp. 3212.3]